MVSAPVRGVGRGCNTEIEGEVWQSWSVTVAVGGVSLGAGCGEFFAARGLSVLPRRDVGRSAGGERRRLQGAAVGWRAGVLIDPEGDVVEMLRGDEFAEVLDGGNGLAGGVVDGLAAGVDAGKIAGVRDGLGPREEVSGLICVEAAAFFLIEKDDGVSGEVFAACGCDGGGGVLHAESGGSGAGAFGAGDLGVGFAVGEDEEAEAVAQECVALADPAVVVCAGRIGEPVSGEGEVLSQRGRGVVAGVVVAVEADGILGCGRGNVIWRDWLRAGCCDEKDESGKGDRG
jgi:hypothetical protein